MNLQLQNIAPIQFASAVCGIYKITSPTNKIYIGQSINIQTRFEYYRKLKCKNQRNLYHSLCKHGFEAHAFEIIHVCGKTELNKWEMHFIKVFDCFNTSQGLNLRGGGSFGGKVSQETRNRLSIVALNRIVSESTKAKQRESAKLRPPMTEATKLKHSVALIGIKRKPLTEEHKAKINWLGRTHKPATIEKMRDSSHHNNFQTGAKKSDLTRKRMSAASQKKRQIIDTVTGEKFSCIRSAAAVHMMSETTLAGMLRGHRKNKTALRHYVAHAGMEIDFNRDPF